MSQPIPVATAVPVTTSAVPVSAHGVVIATTPSHQYNNATPAVIISPQGNYLSPAIQEDERTGLCRKCRRTFQRPPGVNDGQASYYRCRECENSRMDEYIASCTVQ
jgi:hypothetical protein